MPRDYKKKLEWERGRYKQLLFKVSHDEADMHKAHLDANGIRPMDWFRYALSLALVPPAPGEADTSDAAVTSDSATARASVSDAADTGASVKPKRKKLPNATPEMKEEWRRLRREEGMSWVAISAMTGYTDTTIRRRVLEYEEAKGQDAT